VAAAAAGVPGFGGVADCGEGLGAAVAAVEAGPAAAAFGITAFCGCVGVEAVLLEVLKVDAAELLDRALRLVPAEARRFAWATEMTTTAQSRVRSNFGNFGVPDEHTPVLSERHRSCLAPGHKRTARDRIVLCLPRSCRAMLRLPGDHLHANGLRLCSPAFGLTSWERVPASRGILPWQAA
jgi:hypothetical protein